MSNVLPGNIVQQPNRVEVPTTVRQNQIDVPFTAPKDAYQLAKLLDPTIGSLEEWIASLAASPVQMQVDGGHIQWKLEKDEVWISLLALEDIRGDAGLPAYCIGVFASVAALLEAWPNGPGMENLNYWAFASDETDATILWLYRPDPLNNGTWARESITLPTAPLDTDPTLGGADPSDLKAPSQKAVKQFFVDNASIFHEFTDSDQISGGVVGVVPGKLVYVATEQYKFSIRPGEMALFYNDNANDMEIVEPDDYETIGIVPTARLAVVFSGNTYPHTVSIFAFPNGPSEEKINRIFTSPNPPVFDDQESMLWLDSETGRLYCKYGGAWGEIAKPFG